MIIWVAVCAAPLPGQILFEDDFEAYDVENPSDFSINGFPTGNWTPSDPGKDATRIFDTNNFGGTRLWISSKDGTSIVSKGIEAEAYSDFLFTVVLVSETYNGTRQLDATYDLLVGPNPFAAISLIGGPQAVVTHGDDWKIDDSKEDHVFLHEFSTGLMSPDDRLFIEITRVGVHVGSDAWFGVDDVSVRKRGLIEIEETGFSTHVDEDGTPDTLEVFVRDDPPQPVQVIVTADEQVRIDGSSETVLTFLPPVDPNTPQVVAVTAKDDDLEEGLHHGWIDFQSRSTASEWDGYAIAPIEVSIEDNDWPVHHTTNVFTGGQEGYPVYRIPGMNVAPDGSILVFCEGRPSFHDPGAAGLPIDLVMKRSVDNGETWSSIVVLEDNDSFDYSDPCLIRDDLTGAMIVLYTRWPDDKGLFQVPPGTGPDSSNHFILASADNGMSWLGPFNITTQVKKNSWKGMVMGPGSGIQLRRQADPARNGRLVAPAHMHGKNNFIVFSDDFGATWQSAAFAQPMTSGPDANENEVVELADGDLLMNARQAGGTHRRLFRSEDGGATWAEYYPGPFDVTTCDCSMIRYSAQSDGQDRDRILFSGPLGDPAGSAAGRWNIGVRTSYDEGCTFINPVQLGSGFAAYSVLTLLKDGGVGLVYESQSYLEILFVRFTIDQLEKGNHPEALTHYDGFANLVDRSQGGLGWSGFWIGDGSFTGEPADVLGGADVPFDGYSFSMQSGRVDLIEGQAVQRHLAMPLELDTNGTIYISLLISQALDGSPDDDFQETLSITLKNSDDDILAGFGVDSDERFMISSPGDPVATSPDSLERNRSYLLVARLTAQDHSAEGHHDWLDLKVFESGIDRIPPSEHGLIWTLEGMAVENLDGMADCLEIQGDSMVTWSVDEIRIGTSYAAVAGGGPSPLKK
ncbi:MAG: sialidase family protein [Planctomycetota bacterium]